MRSRTATSLREAALTLGAGLGLVCLLLAVAAPLVGVRLLVFESGSMSPTVETGGVALTRSVPADDLAVGDVVSVIPASGVRVTHRIVDIDRTGGPTLLSLKGDANEAADPDPYPVTEADRVIVHVNHLGFVVDALASPYALVAGGAFVAVLLMLAFRRRRPRHSAGGRHRAPVAAGVVVAVALAAAASLVPSRVAPTAAAFTDTADVPADPLTTMDGPQPVASVTCTGGGLGSSLVFVWPNANVRYTYLVQVERPAGTVVSTTPVANNGTVGAQQSATLSLGLLGSLLGISTTFTVRVRSSVTGTWVTASGPTDTGSFTLGLLTSC